MKEKEQEHKLEIAEAIVRLAEEIMYLGNGTFRGTGGHGAIEQMTDAMSTANDNVARSIDTLAGAISEMASAIQTLSAVISETRK